MPSIQRQSILSSVFIYIGFAIGALNMAVSPFIISQDQIGLTKVINEFSFVAGAFATFGAGSLISKFYPYYRNFLPKEKNDLLFTVCCIVGIGLLAVIPLVYFGEKYVLIAFARQNKDLFHRYYWTVFPYILFGLVFLLAEPFFWLLNRVATFNLLKENGFRILTSLLLLLYHFKWIGFDGFMTLYAFLYLLPAAAAMWIIFRSGQFAWYPYFSKVTRRFKSKMAVYSLFIFLTGFLSLVVRVCDTLFIAGQNGFDHATVFIYALYFSQILDVPNRSIGGGAVPVLVEYWRVKNMRGIESVYRKSAMNLMIAGLALGGLIIINLHNAIRFLPSEYEALEYPTIILVLAQLVNLSTGLNATIIHTSINWRFDFISTMIYSVLSIPMNFFFIKFYGIIGAGVATLFSSLFYNIYRWAFLYRKYGLQPLRWQNLELFLLTAVITGVFYAVPLLPELFGLEKLTVMIDIAIRSLIFAVLFGILLVVRNYSAEVSGIWAKWSRKPLQLFRK